MVDVFRMKSFQPFKPKANFTRKYFTKMSDEDYMNFLNKANKTPEYKDKDELEWTKQFSANLLSKEIEDFKRNLLSISKDLVYISESEYGFDWFFIHDSKISKFPTSIKFSTLVKCDKQIKTREQDFENFLDELTEMECCGQDFVSFKKDIVEFILKKNLESKIYIINQHVYDIIWMTFIKKEIGLFGLKTIRVST